MKILFISPRMGAEGIATGGHVVFRKFLSRIPKSDIILLSICGYKNQTSEWMKDYKYYFSNSIFFYPLINKIFIKTFLRKMYFFYEWNIYAFFTVKKIQKIIKKESVDKIWTLGIGETASILKKIHQHTEIPYHLSVMDDMLEKDFYLRNLYSKKLQKTMMYILKNYKSCDLISPYMRDYYIKKYDICKDAFNIWAGFVDYENVKLPVVNNKIKKIAHIGSIVRNMYEEHWALWEAIEVINKNRSEDTKITLDYYTHSFNVKRLGIENQKNINCCGLIPDNVFIETLNKYDLLYVNMWFHPDWNVHNITSFPSKTISYIASAVPILSIGPEGSTIIQFINKYKAGLPVTSIEPRIIAKAILDFENNISLRKHVSENLFNLAQNDLNFNKNWPKFKRLLYNSSFGVENRQI